MIPEAPPGVDNPTVCFFSVPRNQLKQVYRGPWDRVHGCVWFDASK